MMQKNYIELTYKKNSIAVHKDKIEQYLKKGWKVKDAYEPKKAKVKKETN